MKFHAFRVPPSTDGSPTYHKVELVIDPLTPGFYPKVFLRKNELQREPSQTTELKFPSLVSYDDGLEFPLAFGENPFYQLNSNKFVYTFTGSATSPYVYYTVAVYQHTWGLTSYRKSAYQASVDADVTTAPPARAANGV